MKRETIAYERILYYMGNSLHMSFAFRIKTKRIIKKDKLAEALSRVKKRHLLAGVRVEMTDDKKQYITTENVPGIPLHEISQNEADWKALLKKELCRRFDIFKGPMVRVFLIQNKSEDTSDIIVIFHHAICDGLSAVLFLHDLFSFLENPELPIETYPEAPIFTKLIKKDILRILKEKDLPDWIKNMEIPELKAVHPKPRPQPDYAVHNWFFTEKVVSRIISFAKKNNVSVHAVLGAALLRAFSVELNQNNDFKGVLQSPVSFRPYLVERAEKYFGLFNGIFSASVDCNPQRTIPEIALEIYTKLKEHLAGYESLTGYYFFNEHYLDKIDDPELFFANRPDQPLDYDFSLSNLGKIKMQGRCGKYEIEEIYGPIFSAIRGERVISVTTFQKKMFFTFIYDKKCFDSDLADKIIKRVLDILKNTL